MDTDRLCAGDIGVDVCLVDQGGPGVDDHWTGGEGVDGVIGFEGGAGVLMDLGERLETDVSHGVRLLGDGGGDAAILDVGERVLIAIHGDEGAVGCIGALEYLRDCFARIRFQADEGVDACRRQFFRGTSWFDRRHCWHLPLMSTTSTILSAGWVEISPLYPSRRSARFGCSG